MRLTQLIKCLACLVLAALVTGCATPQAYDYTAFKQSRPRSVLILPPVNNSPEVGATYSLFSQLSYPLAESGYYVFPVALVDETFRQNGLASATDIHSVPPTKLREIFGADSALYVTITQYGAKYMVLNSVVSVTAQARLVDLKTGALLWEGAATAADNEGNNNSGSNIFVMLAVAAISQIANNLTDSGHKIAGITSQRLLSAGRMNGVLYGPRSPNYGTDGITAK